MWGSFLENARPVSFRMRWTPLWLVLGFVCGTLTADAHRSGSHRWQRTYLTVGQFGPTHRPLNARNPQVLVAPVNKLLGTVPALYFIEVLCTCRQRRSGWQQDTAYAVLSIHNMLWPRLLVHQCLNFRQFARPVASTEGDSSSGKLSTGLSTDIVEYMIPY